MAGKLDEVSTRCWPTATIMAQCQILADVPPPAFPDASLAVPAVQPDVQQDDLPDPDLPVRRSHMYLFGKKYRTRKWRPQVNRVYLIWQKSGRGCSVGEP